MLITALLTDDAKLSDPILKEKVAALDPGAAHYLPQCAGKYPHVVVLDFVGETKHICRFHMDALSGLNPDTPAQKPKIRRWGGDTSLPSVSDRYFALSAHVWAFADLELARDFVKTWQGVYPRETH